MAFITRPRFSMRTLLAIVTGCCLEAGACRVLGGIDWLVINFVLVLALLIARGSRPTLALAASLRGHRVCRAEFLSALFARNGTD